MLTEKRLKEIRSVLGEAVFDASASKEACIKRAESLKAELDKMILSLKGE